MAHLTSNDNNEAYSGNFTGSPSIDSMMREVLHMLGNIDFEHEVELDRLEKSSTDRELKLHIRKKIRAAYEERREPYLELLTTLRKRQHRTSISRSR